MLLLTRLDISVVFDVGGHWGEFGQRLRRLGYRGRIVSFEPFPESVQRLRAVADRDADWMVFPVALGEADGETTLHVSRSHTDFASVLLPNAYSVERFGATTRADDHVTIPLRRLDGVFAEATAGLREPRVLLKMDTQGADLAVLSGVGAARQAIAAIQTELAVKALYDGMTSFPETLARIAAMGFEITGLFPVTRDHDGLRVIEFDGVFVSAHGIGAPA